MNPLERLLAAQAPAPAPAPAALPHLRDVSAAPATLAGRCASGAELGAGMRVHLVRGQLRTDPPRELYGTALCGAKPGRRSVGWTHWPGANATCPRCQGRWIRELERAALVVEQRQAEASARARALGQPARQTAAEEGAARVERDPRQLSLPLPAVHCWWPECGCRFDAPLCGDAGSGAD